MMLAGLIITVAVLEVALVVCVRHYRQQFQWLITEQDECPTLDIAGLNKFIAHGFDPHLGWVRKPGTTGYDKTKDGRAKYTIDATGARVNPMNEGKDDIIASFGDSYTFCRQVEDQETWQACLTHTLGCGVSNYGVGNYGVDQAVLRYERTELPSSVRVVILGFVPETICRISSYWKHYLEFGNTFAFKPRFQLHNGRMDLVPNAMQSAEDFSRYRDMLPDIRRHDGFYEPKFRSYQFRFPYLLSYLRHPLRNLELFSKLIRRSAARKAGRPSPKTEQAPFAVIMQDNIHDAHRRYSDTESRDLLKAILLRFRDDALRRGHRPVVLVMPQLLDFKSVPDFETTECHRFFEGLKGDMAVVNLAGALPLQRIDDLYAEDLFGGHFSAEGNALISSVLQKFLEMEVPAITCS